MQSILQAISIGSIVEQVLPNEDGGFIGEVTHTFPTSLYVRTVNDSLIFVTERHLRSPVTVNIDSTLDIDQLTFPGDRLYAHGSEIHTVKGLRIELHEAKLYEPPSSFQKGRVDLQPGRIAESLRLASFILGIVDTTRSLLDPRGLAHEKTTSFVRSGIESLAPNHNCHALDDAAMELTGLGYGFTPSGDDFLGGFLAVYNSLAWNVGSKPLLLSMTEVRKRTPWHSAMLLDYMQRLVLDEQLSEIVNSAVEARKDRLVEAMEAIMSRGHTSGIDISLGIVLALSMILDLKLHRRDTEKLATRLGLQRT